MIEQWLDKLERRYGRYSGIRNLMQYVVAGMAAVFVADLLLIPMLGVSASSYLAFNREAVLHGQIWRLITFIFIPPDSSMLFIIFSLLFYWMVGTMLQNNWGTFRFTLYYLCGMVGAVASGCITGYATNYYLNMSLFFACALLYPEMQLSMYFVIPVKMKWLAILDAVLLLLSFLQTTWAGRLSMVFALLNVLLFFGGRFITMGQDAYRRYQWKKNWR